MKSYIHMKLTVCIDRLGLNVAFRRDGQMDAWMDGWMEGWMNGWMHAWMDE